MEQIFRHLGFVFQGSGVLPRHIVSPDRHHCFVRHTPLMCRIPAFFENWKMMNFVSKQPKQQRFRRCFLIFFQKMQDTTHAHSLPQVYCASFNWSYCSKFCRLLIIRPQIIQMQENPFLDDFFTISNLFRMIFMLPTTKDEWKTPNPDLWPNPENHTQTRKSHPNTQTLAANPKNHTKKPKPWP